MYAFCRNNISKHIIRNNTQEELNLVQTTKMDCLGPKGLQSILKMSAWRTKTNWCSTITRIRIQMRAEHELNPEQEKKRRKKRFLTIVSTTEGNSGSRLNAIHECFCSLLHSIVSFNKCNQSREVCVKTFCCCVCQCSALNSGFVNMQSFQNLKRKFYLHSVVKIVSRPHEAEETICFLSCNS